MKKGNPRQIQYTPRAGQMSAVNSIRDAYDLLVELITNADDSYHGLFSAQRIPQDGGVILVEIEPHRSETPSVVRVCDRAAGFRDLASKLEWVGDKTSHPGDRGFMARGLKDCAALGHILVETIVDGHLDKAEITPSFDLIPYAPSRKGGDKASKADRQRLGIAHDGTVVTVSLEPRVKVPLLETLRRELPWHYALRDITRAGGPSKVLLRYSGSEPEPLFCSEPDADVVYDHEHEVPGYPGRRFRFTLWRAKDSLVNPVDSRFRRTGALIKGRRAIYGCSFLRSELERDPAAENYFGRIECADIDVLAEEWDERRERGERHPPENPAFLLDPNRREGLVEDHPFVRSLFSIPVDVIKREFEEERQRRESRHKEVEARETTDRLRKLAREASRFMREKLDDLGAAAPGDVVNDTSFNKTGVGISPVFTQIRVGETKTFTVKVNNEKLELPAGTSVAVRLSKAAEESVALSGAPTDLEVDPIDTRLLRGVFSLEGAAESHRVQVGCQVDALDPVYVELQVLPADPLDREIPGGFAFHRKTYTVRHGRRRTLVLRARSDRASLSHPKLRFENDAVAVVRERSEFELVPGTTYYEATFNVEGRQVNGRTRVIAQADGRSAECELLVVEKEESGVDLKFELVDQDLGASYRAVWDRKEQNTLKITTRHESIRRYLGPEPNYPGQRSEAFRVLLAELISDNVCRRIVDEYARAQPHDFDSDKVYRLHNQLMKEFTPLAHRIQLASPSIPADT
jgi:hypothetical protein